MYLVVVVVAFFFFFFFVCLFFNDTKSSVRNDKVQENTSQQTHNTVTTSLQRHDVAVTL